VHYYLEKPLKKSSDIKNTYVPKRILAIAETLETLTVVLQGV